MTLFNVVYILSNIVIIIEKLNLEQRPVLVSNGSIHMDNFTDQSHVITHHDSVLPLKFLTGKLHSLNYWSPPSHTRLESELGYKTIGEIPEKTKDRILMWSVISNLCLRSWTHHGLLLIHCTHDFPFK